MSQASDEMPMPGGAWQETLLDVASMRSVYEIMQQVHGLAAELRMNRHSEAAKMADSVHRDPSNGRPMYSLLHSMNKGMIKAVVGGTVALDSAKGLQWYDAPGESEAAGGGVYMIGLSRLGGNGEFLTVPEIRQLIDGLRRYGEGTRLLIKGRRASPEDQAKIDFVKQVDKAYHPTYGTPGTPRFSGMNTVAINDLIRSLERRCRPNADPTVRQKQSPLYVGCSGQLQSCLKSYREDQKLVGVNKLLALTVSVLRVLNLRVSMTVKVAIRVWEEGQLQLAEQLVAVMAQSLVTQTGFNTIAAGRSTDDRTGPQGYMAAKKVVMEDNTWMEQNLDETLAETQRRKDLLEEFEDTQDDLETLEGLVREGMESLDRIPDAPTLEDLEALRKSSESRLLRLQSASEGLGELLAHLYLAQDAQKEEAGSDNELD